MTSYKIKNYYSYKSVVYRLFASAFLIVFSLSFTSCGNDDKFTDSIFIDKEVSSHPFDVWLDQTYRVPYNLRFQYKMQDMASDMDYNLVPTSLDQSHRLAILIKYLWFDAYNVVAGEDFMKQNGPRIIHLIGSPAFNPDLGTITLGTAEGGIKITLYRCNDLDPKRVAELNEYYFKTMHHEFAHILHQKKTYPKEFETFSAGKYDPMYWQNRTVSEAATYGFVTPYGSSQPREDFVEVIANYIVKSDKEWNTILELASKPGVNGTGQVVISPLALNGKVIIETKLGIAKKWLSDAWGIDLELLRKEVQGRQLHIDEVLSQSYW